MNHKAGLLGLCLLCGSLSAMQWKSIAETVVATGGIAAVGYASWRAYAHWCLIVDRAYVGDCAIRFQKIVHGSNNAQQVLREALIDGTALDNLFPLCAYVAFVAQTVTHLNSICEQRAGQGVPFGQPLRDLIDQLRVVLLIIAQSPEYAVERDRATEYDLRKQELAVMRVRLEQLQVSIEQRLAVVDTIATQYMQQARELKDSILLLQQSLDGTRLQEQTATRERLVQVQNGIEQRLSAMESMTAQYTYDVRAFKEQLSVLQTSVGELHVSVNRGARAERDKRSGN